MNDLPTTSDQSESATEDLTKTITLTSSDPDTGDTITYSIVSDVSNGSTSLSGSTVTYNSTSNYNGSDSFTFKANDGTGDSNTSTATITVAAVNDAPVTTGVNEGESTISATEDINKDINLSSYTTDIEGNSLTYTIVSQPNDGTISVSGSTATYAPDSNFNGGQSFEFKANDGTDDSNTSQLNLSLIHI